VKRKLPDEARVEGAREVALAVLTFLAANPEHLGRFLAVTGVGPGQLRGLVDDAGFQVGLLEFVLGDESLLLAFAESARVRPTAIAIARNTLAGEAGEA
jgi:hypothetical protein